MRTRSWTDGIDSDAFADLLVGQCSCESDNSTLSRSIVKQVPSSDVGVHGSTIDDGRASLEMRHCVFGQIEVRMNVGIERILPLLSEA